MAETPKGRFKVNLVVYPEAEEVIVEQNWNATRPAYGNEMVFEGYTIEFDLPLEVLEELERQREAKAAKTLDASWSKDVTE